MTDIAFRMFLRVDSYNTLPDPSSLCRFPRTIPASTTLKNVRIQEHSNALK